MNLLLRISNYIIRYAPSEKKLREYISKKNHTIDISLFLKEIGYTESMMCDIWIKSYVAGGKGKDEISEKIRKKGFKKEIIEEKILENQEEIISWQSHKNHIEGLIENLLKKGKSKRVIFLEIQRKYPYFQEEISSIIDKSSDTTGLEKALEKYLIKYDISDLHQKSNFFNALFRKGFSYKDIQERLRNRP